MTHKEKQLIKEYMLGNLSAENFLKSYPVKLAEHDNYILQVLWKAYDTKNSEDVDYAFTLLTFDHNFSSSNKYAEVLCKLLTQDWHYRHEDIVSLLQGIRYSESVEVIYQTALKKFDYLDYDDTYSLARKCIHALGTINTEESKQKLLLLSKSDVFIIREKAEKQLSYN